MSRPKNILEGILRDFLERSLSLRFDIFTCRKCRMAMMDYLLSKFPPEYVDPHSPNYREIEKKVIQKYLKKIFEEISKAIDLVDENLPHPREEDKEEAFDNLISKIKEDRGVDFSQYHREILKRRIALRLVANKIKSYTEYLTKLTHDPHEYEKLFSVLTINVSEFFRDPMAWDEIRVILEGIIKENTAREESVRLWSAGCATGEEAYSLAILVHQITGSSITPVKIFATDIDRNSLKQARLGVYQSLKFKNVDKKLVERYFLFDRGNYTIKDEIKNMVEFSYLDFTSSHYIEDVDMILCRNVFIYFTKPLQERIMDHFYRSLKTGGYLIIGKTETLVPGAKLIFKEVNMEERIYQKVNL